MYIVTSKPKRISEYSGLVHMSISPVKSEITFYSSNNTLVLV